MIYHLWLHKVKVNIYEFELWETTEQGLKTKQSPNGEVVLALLFSCKKGRTEPEVPKAVCGIPLVVHFSIIHTTVLPL